MEHRGSVASRDNKRLREGNGLEEFHADYHMNKKCGRKVEEGIQYLQLRDGRVWPEIA
jgi:hypothetical protein